MAKTKRSRVFLGPGITLIVCHKAWIGIFVIGVLNVQGCFIHYLNFHSLFIIVNPMYFSCYSFFNNIFFLTYQKKEKSGLCYPQTESLIKTHDTQKNLTIQLLPSLLDRLLLGMFLLLLLFYLNFIYLFSFVLPLIQD